MKISVSEHMSKLRRDRDDLGCVLSTDLKRYVYFNI